MRNKINSIWARSGKGFYISAIALLILGIVGFFAFKEELGTLAMLILPAAFAFSAFMAFAAYRRDKLIKAFRSSDQVQKGVVEGFSLVYLQEFASRKYTYRLVIKATSGEVYKSLDLLSKTSWAKEGIEIGTELEFKISDADKRFCLVD